MSRFMYPFAEAIEDASAGAPRLQQSAFAKAGTLPIVDQGQSLIAGYTDDLSVKCRVQPPVIVFGDHTRLFKFIDFPFVVGADGVKVLRVREGWDAKYVFHYLRSRGLPSAGYSRHFKFLKEICVPRPPLDEQRRIAVILDQADALHAKRRAVATCLDDLAQAVFVDTFASGSWPVVSAGELMPDMRNGLSPATAGRHSADVLTLSAVTQGAFHPAAYKRGQFAVEPPLDKRVSARDFLVCRGNGNKHLVGVGVFSEVDMPQLVFPDTVIAGRVDHSKVTMQYLAAVWHQPNLRRQIEAVARTTNGTYKVNQQTLSSVLVPLPPLHLQREFDQRVGQLNVQRVFIHRALDAQRDLLDTVQVRAFAGQL